MIKYFFIIFGFFVLVGSAAMADPSANIKVDIRIGTALEDKMPVGENTAFTIDDDQVIGWTRVKGATEPVDIIHEWVHKGKVRSKVNLPIRSSSYRTWSRKSLNGRTGEWELRVSDEFGRLIDSKKFLVNP